jgi:histidyl-tRNA synthetase
MLEKGIPETALEKVQPLFNFTGTIAEKIEKLGALLKTSEEGTKGVEELQFICNAIDTLGLQSANFDLDVTLARGLNYYTGAIFEVAAPAGVAMGSIGGGGRYDDLTGIFGLKNMSGVGISFGLDRIYLVLEELGLFPETVTTKPQALFINFGDHEALYAMQAMAQLRAAGVRVELFPDKAKLDKQFKYAEKKGIPFVIFVGDEEIANRTFKLKNNHTREEQIVHLAALTAVLQ